MDINIVHLLSSRLYCRLWNLTKSCPAVIDRGRLVGFTTGRESHPALKTYYLLMWINITQKNLKIKGFSISILIF